MLLYLPKARLGIRWNSQGENPAMLYLQGNKMKRVSVLGDCDKCKKTEEMFKDISEEMAVDLIVKKDTDPQSLVKFKVTKTPAVVIDGELVHSGSVPSRADIEEWLRD